MSDNPLLGCGWSFPVRLVNHRLPKPISGEEKIRQSIRLILSTAPGERQMRPEFGCGIHDLLFQPNTATLRSKVAEKVRDALIRWEPRIDVNDVRVEVPAALDAKNHLIIRIDYRVRANNTFYNLVYPFFLTEGTG